ncbi:MAG: DeoR/GlpR family DNA-binding transcription regulator [Planctomycetota bacterium]|nr:DeoR/GlpR family DNA-binding transcription regulator [Planctomycetota bacterium]
MNTYSRRQSLLDLLRRQSGLSVRELAKTLDVSEGTVRNDLNALEGQGKLTRIHGGAILNENDQFQNNYFKLRSQINLAAKLAIAREVAALVKDGDSILLDASSTIYFFARALSERSKLRVVTNGFEAARELAQNSSNDVFLIGGLVNNDSSSVTGLLSERIIDELRIQKAFLSCSGFSLERGMTEVHLAEAQLKRKVIESSQQLYALVDSSKFGQEDMTSFLSSEKIMHLFTDTGLSPEWIEKLKLAGINFTLCAEKAVLTK